MQFLVLQLKQWRKEFPRRFNSALMRPPVDAAKLPEPAKGSGDALGGAIETMASLASATDVLTNSSFKAELDHALAAAKDLNQAMAGQRLPAGLVSAWDQIRSMLNSLARIYRLEMLPVLEPPAGGGGRGGRGAPVGAPGKAKLAP